MNVLVRSGFISSFILNIDLISDPLHVSLDTTYLGLRTLLFSLDYSILFPRMVDLDVFNERGISP